MDLGVNRALDCPDVGNNGKLRFILDCRNIDISLKQIFIWATFIIYLAVFSYLADWFVFPFSGPDILLLTLCPQVTAHMPLLLWLDKALQVSSVPIY